MAGQRMTPVQAAKALGIRPQMVYGFIKSGRARTYPNMAGKTQLVDLDEVRSIAGSVKHHRPRDSSGKPIKRSAGVSRGTLLSSHGHFRGERQNRPHRVSVVGAVGNLDGDLDGSYVWTLDADGAPRIMYEEDHLASMIQRRQCHIESPASLLGVLMFHWSEQGRPDLAGALRMWCEVNEVPYTEVQESQKSA